jgi:hypothetical protein
MSHFASLSAPLLASWLMRHSLPLLFEIVLVLWILTFVSLALSKDTLKTSDVTSLSASSSRTLGILAQASFRAPVAAVDPQLSDIPRHPMQEASEMHPASLIVRKIQGYVQDAFADFMSQSLIVCFAIFFFKRLAFTSETFVFQYASKVLKWKFEKTAWIQFTHSLAAIITTAVLLPVVTAYFQKNRHFRRTTIDVTVARASLLVAIIGCLLLWRARNPPAMISGKITLYVLS